MFSVFVKDVGGDWDNSLLAKFRTVVNSLSTTSMAPSEGVALWLSSAIHVDGVGVFFVVELVHARIRDFEVLAWGIVRVTQ